MYIKPLELDVPEKEPFQKDILNRKEQVEILTDRVDAIEGPCVLAIDAEWGMGKTTFLRMWSQHMCNNGFPIIEFNAWETDFSDNPLLTVSIELTDGLKKYIRSSKLTRIVDKLNGLLYAILEQKFPTSMRVVSASRNKSSYERAKNSIAELRNSLQDVANNIKEKKGHPLIMMIDELDRCRPSYAIEFLEVIKHLFSVDNIIFVLAVNRSEMGHSIKALYGNKFDSQKYLERFIDVDYKLEEPSYDAYADFIDTLISEINLEKNYINKTQDSEAERGLEFSISMFKNFFGTSDISLRAIEQAIFRFGLLYSSLKLYKSSFASGAAVALIMRTLEPDKYRKFISGDITGTDVYDNIIAPIINHPRRDFFKVSKDGRSRAGIKFQATIILASMTRKRDGFHVPKMKEDSLLWHKYTQLAATEPEVPSDNSTYMSESRLAQNVLDIVNENIEDAHDIVDFGFWYMESISFSCHRC